MRYRLLSGVIQYCVFMIVGNIQFITGGYSRCRSYGHGGISC